MMFSDVALKMLLVERGISLSQLSIATGICHSSLTRLHNGQTKNPGFETVESLADYFKVNMETFIKRGAC